MEVTLHKGTSGGTQVKDVTSYASFSSSKPGELAISGSTLKGMQSVSDAAVRGSYQGRSALLSVSVVDQHVEVSALELSPFPELFRGRQSSDGSVSEASPCIGSDSCVTTSRLLPIVTLNDGTVFSFVSSEVVRG